MTVCIKFCGNVLLATMLFLTYFNSSQALADCGGKTIRAGWEDWHPYQMKLDGKLTGIDVDLVTAIIEKYSGCKLEWTEGPWRALLKKVELGELDVVAAASSLPEREVYANFSNTYRSEIMSLFVKQGTSSNYKITNLEELIAAVKKGGFDLGLIRGYSYGKAFDDARKNDAVFNKHLYEEIDENRNISLIKKGRIQGMITDQSVGNYMIQQDKKTPAGSSIESYPLVVSDSPISLMFSKKSVSPELVKSINEAIAKVEKSGEKQQLINKYK